MPRADRCRESRDVTVSACGAGPTRSLPQNAPRGRDVCENISIAYGRVARVLWRRDLQRRRETNRTRARREESKDAKNRRRGRLRRSGASTAGICDPHPLRLILDGSGVSRVLSPLTSDIWSESADARTLFPGPEVCPCANSV